MASQAELEVRRAVRTALADLPAGATVLVACSGGADSVAMAAAAKFVGDRAGLVVGGVTVDHGLQPGAAQRARQVGAMLTRWRLDPVEVIHVSADAGRGAHGPEGNARVARYAAMDASMDRCGASAVLLGHTRDDQAESVLLGLARGSGGRSLSGMAPVAGRYRRPLLDLSRETVRAAVPRDVTPWEDPHNTDPAYARSRVRHSALPALEKELGPGVSDALARTAALLRADADALDDWARRAYADAIAPSSTVDHGRITLSGGEKSVIAHDQHGVRPGVRLSVGVLEALPTAIRTRVLRMAAVAAGSPATELTAAHVVAVDALIGNWRGQRGIDLPGKIRARRRGGVITVAASAASD
jgi:tRNA(Ile)-lysidine synthetase-like protein